MMAQTRIIGISVVRIVIFWCILKDDLSSVVGWM